MDFQKILNSRVTTLALVALVAVFGIHVLTRWSENLRADFTSDNLYSLTDGTEAILARLQEEGVKPLEIKLYFSETAGKSLPKFIKDFITYEKYIRALLGEYEIAAEGKLKVSFIDPMPDTDEAQDAADYGLDGKPINQHGDLFFFGLVFQTQTGSRDVIDFLWPNQQETIEYEISKRIQSMVWPTKQRVGVMSSLEVVSDASDPYMAQVLRAQGKAPGES
ncbi:MAG: GldG family protein, partial [bacterium]|nr:GldG family protein [bacterium]